MINAKSREGLLSSFRILDLTDELGFLCGKILGDLGADVVKVERPGGDPARLIGPFYQDQIHPEKSLCWFAFNNNKRGITLNLERPRGRDIFAELVARADF
ncbi:MAG: CoA transferase, partial [Deltaproteobacteria bacterium]